MGLPDGKLSAAFARSATGVAATGQAQATPWHTPSIATEWLKPLGQVTCCGCLSIARAWRREQPEGAYHLLEHNVPPRPLALAEGSASARKPIDSAAAPAGHTPQFPATLAKHKGTSTCPMMMFTEP